MPLAGLLLGIIGLAALASHGREVAGTTLRAPWGWAIFSLAALVAWQLVAGTASPSAAWLAHLRYAAAVTTLCPLMAVLGAKRPQDRGWQFIVASLAVVLMLPAAAALVRRPDLPLELHAAWRWFLAVLLAIGLFNGLGTRHAAAMLLAVSGQAALLAEHLPLVAWLVPEPLAPERFTAAFGLLVTAVVLWACPAGRGDRAPLDRVWLDFRDAFGTIWALRVADRLNATAVLAGWPIRLGWNGFYPTSGPTPGPAAAAALDPEVERNVVRTLRTLLRRFVSPEWIDARLSRPPPAGERGASAP